MNKKKKSLQDELVDDLLELEDQHSNSEEQAKQKSVSSDPKNEGKKDPGIKESLRKMMQLKMSAKKESDSEKDSTKKKSDKDLICETVRDPMGDLIDKENKHIKKDKNDDKTFQIDTQSQGVLGLYLNPISDKKILQENIRASQSSVVSSQEHKLPFEQALSNAEHLRLAQDRVLSIEKELENARRENEKLMVAGEIVNQRNQELLSKNNKLEKSLESLSQDFQRETDLLKESIEFQTKKIKDLQQKNEEYDVHLNAKIKKISRRERELENRIEILKKESEILLKSKNEDMIHLNRQIDQLNMEIENFRKKGLKLNQELQQKDEMMNKTIKALKMALNILDQKVGLNVKLKKAE